MDGLAALAWQVELGADEALEPVPRNRLSQPAGARRPSPVLAAPPVLPPAVTDAAGAAAAADTPEALRAAIAAFTGCALSVTATNPVFAEGDPTSGLLLIGDAPSDSDDRAGRPFTGPAGAFLDQILASIGLDRSRLLLTPLIPWRPPGGRAPSPAERALCLPFLIRLVVLTRPRFVVLAGALAARDLLGGAGARGMRGSWQALAVPDLPPIPALMTEDPGFLLRNPGAPRRRAWAEWRMLRRSMDDDITKS